MQKQRKIGKYWICNISAKEVEHTRKVQFISRRRLETRHTRNTPTGMGHLFDTWCLHTFCPKITAIRSNSRCHESLEFCVGRFGIFAASLNRIEVPFCWDSMCDILYIFHNIMSCTCVFSKHLRRRDASQKNENLELLKSFGSVICESGHFQEVQQLPVERLFFS